MKIATRRRLAVGVLATTSALIAGALVAAPSQAVGTVTVDPPAATNTGIGADARTISFTTTTPYPQTGMPDGRTGTQVELQRSGTTDDVIRGDVVETSPPTPSTTTRAVFNFSTQSSGPANPGRYDVFVYEANRATADSCTGCFTIFASAPVVTSVNVPSLPTGTQGQIFAVDGSNFAKSTTVEALFPDTQTVDPNIRFTAATTGSGVTLATIANTATRLSRTIRVDPSTLLGPRDIRVTNTDGSEGLLKSGLRITSALITLVDPNASGNDGPVRRKFTGRGFQLGSVPSLVNESAGTSIVGRDIQQVSEQSISAAFDVTNASPGTYRAQLTAPDGSTTTPECSPTYTIVNTAGGSGTAATKASEFSCAQASATQASPSAGATPNATASSTATPSASPTGSAGARENARYAALATPSRVLDTRSNRGPRRTGEIVLDLSQRISDTNATAAVLNVTVTNPTRRGFLVAYPNGTTKPGTSNVSFEAAQTQANEVVVGLSSQRRVSLFVDSAEAHVIVDLVGFFTTTSSPDTGRVTTSTPARALDSRSTETPRRRGEVVVNLSSLLPSGATDAILNVTVQGPDDRGFVVAYPTGTPRPPTSNVNFERGQTQANEVVTRVGTGNNAGRVSLFIDSASTAIIVDVVGAVTPGATAGSQVYTALAQPARASDTRANSGPRRSGAFDVTMPSSVPSSATGVVLNVTATNGTRSGFVAVYPAGQSNPGTSNVNFPGERAATRTTPASAGTQANEVITRLGNDRSVTLFVGGRDGVAAHVIVDVVGFLTGTGAPAASAAPSASPRPSASCTPSVLTTCPTGSPSPAASASPAASVIPSPRPS